MSKMIRTWLVVLTIAALLMAAATYAPTQTTAANLTGGQYTYIINGEEVAFTFDPVIRKEGTLLPTEVFTQFGIRVDGALTRNVVLMKDEQSVKVTLGSNVAEVQGDMIALTTSPLRLNGRLFLPSELLREFGIEVSLDGNLVVLRTFVGAVYGTRERTREEWDRMTFGHSFYAQVKMDSGLNAYSEFTLLNTDIINSSNLDVSYGVRARLLSLLSTNTLVMVKLSNVSHKSGAITTTSVYLVDELRNQYDLLSVMDIGKGLVSGKLAPGADRVGILVYPKANAKAYMLHVFYDPAGANLGAFTNIQ